MNTIGNDIESADFFLSSGSKNVYLTIVDVQFRNDLSKYTANDRAAHLSVAVPQRTARHVVSLLSAWIPFTPHKDRFFISERDNAPHKKCECSPIPNFGTHLQPKFGAHLPRSDFVNIL